MKYLNLLAIGALFFLNDFAEAKNLKVFNLNVFDQLQGEWKEDFRSSRIKLISEYVREINPDILVFQEAKGLFLGEKNDDSIDAELFKKEFPFQKYIHEMLGKDGASYGYWMASKKKPITWLEDGFSFPGGVPRRVQAGVWGESGSCVGILSLHLSYQNSQVRQKEAKWILDWIKSKENLCKAWLVVGDFNADKEDEEMKILFRGPLKSLYFEAKPTVGAFNPIRRIYGENIPSRTIDWALGWNLEGKAEVVLDTPYLGGWVSDHAAVLVDVKQ